MAFAGLQIVFRREDDNIFKQSHSPNVCSIVVASDFYEKVKRFW